MTLCPAVIFIVCSVQETRFATGAQGEVDIWGWVQVEFPHSGGLWSYISTFGVPRARGAALCIFQRRLSASAKPIFQGRQVQMRSHPRSRSISKIHSTDATIVTILMGQTISQHLYHTKIIIVVIFRFLDSYKCLRRRQTLWVCF